MNDQQYHITSDEVNCLVHAYLRDSGFEHATFALRSEARLDKSAQFRKHIPHGELVDLLGRALLFKSVECHPSGRKGCIVPVLLLDRHTCSSSGIRPLLPAAITSHAAAMSVSTSPPIVHSASSPPAAPDKIGKRKGKGKEPAPDLNPPDMDSFVPMEIDLATSAVSDQDFLASKEHDAIQILSGNGSQIYAVAWNPMNPSLFASGSKDTTVNMWKVDPAPRNIISPMITPAKPQSTTKLTDKDDADISSMDWNPFGTLLAVGGCDGSLHVLTTSGDIYFKDSSTHKNAIYTTRFSPLGKWLVTVSLDDRVCVWNIEQRLLYRAPLIAGPCLDVAWYSESIYVVCGNDRQITVLDVHSDVVVTVLVGHEQEVNHVRINRKKTMIASASDDHTTRIWLGSSIDALADLTPGMHSITQCVVLRGHGAPVTSVAWSGVGEHEVVATSCSRIEDAEPLRLWDPRTGQCIHQFVHHTAIFSLLSNKSGRLLAVASNDDLHLYDMNTKTKVCSWCEEWTTEGVFELAFQATSGYERLLVGLGSGQLAIVNLNRLPFLNL
ncbi:WD40 repeat-like protein [Peniophora sp. CONT]|nr:WD40 repeat-like protein [Peniophora sp. CONT]